MPDTTEIRPALDAGEWEEFTQFGKVVRDSGGQHLVVHSKGKGFHGLQRISIQAAAPADLECHAIAALTLYGQPFGFTREDVLFLRESANDALTDCRPSWAAHLNGIADRIAALLPPHD